MARSLIKTRVFHITEEGGNEDEKIQSSIEQPETTQGALNKMRVAVEQHLKHAQHSSSSSA